MTAQELINELGRLEDKDIPVLMDNCDGGLDDVEFATKTRVVLDFNLGTECETECELGLHEYSENILKVVRESLVQTDALVLSREE